MLFFPMLSIDYEQEPLQKNQHRAPQIGPLGSGSDYTVFIDKLGIMSADLSFGDGYGAYHSVYDSYGA